MFIFKFIYCEKIYKSKILFVSIVISTSYLSADFTSILKVENKYKKAPSRWAALFQLSDSV